MLFFVTLCRLFADGPCCPSTEETALVMEQITALDLYVRVYWVGDHLTELVRRRTDNNRWVMHTYMHTYTHIKIHTYIHNTAGIPATYRVTIEHCNTV